MKKGVIKPLAFYLSVASFILASSLSTLNIQITDVKVRVLVLIISIVLFIWIQIEQSKKVSEKTKEKMINLELRSFDKFAKLLPELRIRSNIFIQNQKRKFYYIKNKNYSHNMDAFQDINIQIPFNMGCTGEAWRTKAQVFGDEQRIHEGGGHRIPDDQHKLVPRDLNWIISTPIKNTEGEVIAVMNIDGNKAISPEIIRDIEEQSSMLAPEISEIMA